MNPSSWPRRAPALVTSLFTLIAAAPPCLAQDGPAPEPSRIIVTGNPLGSGTIAAPVSELSGDGLVLRRGSSLGETLNSLPGVSSTYAGPNANRPIVRGLDGDRVRMLSNAGASLDASSLSFDHAVPIDPLIVERVEVLRGPGTLLYGGSAVGGVVNAIDNRIPDEPIDGVSGAAELRLGGADRERGGAALVEAGDRRFALHADVFGRRTADLQVPRHVPVEDGEPLPATDRVRSSASRTHGGAFGGSVFFDRGHVGLSADTYRSTYGAVAEAGIEIDMEREHLGLAGEARELTGPLREVRVRLNHTRYRHQEVEPGGEIGTTFKTAGQEARVEADHTAIGPMRGVLGLQIEDFDFSALGEEAFVPSTRTRRQALFALEELPWHFGTLSAGLRLERARVHSSGDPQDAEPRFGPAAERSFNLRSASLSNVLALDSRWNLSGALGYTERAPTSFELFANGVHAATGTFERGDPTLQAERGTNLDLAVQRSEGPSHWRLGVFTTRFSRFIALDASGQNIDRIGEGGEVESVPEYLFQPVRARLNGIELDGRQRLIEQPWTLDITTKLDVTRATNLDTGEPLPRVAPLRALLGLDLLHGPWGGRFEVDHAARQNRVPATDVATAGYTLLNLTLTRSFDSDRLRALWFLKLGNLGDRLAYSASTVPNVRALAPLPGRSVRTGLRVTF